MPGFIRVFFHTVATLGCPVQMEQTFTCTRCGREIRKEITYQSPGASVKTYTKHLIGGRSNIYHDHRQDKIVQMRATIISEEDNTKRLVFVYYPAIYLSDSREVLPTHEGTISDATVVDQYGDPELMTSFAQHYLLAYRSVMPSGRPPRSVVEIMPALHLLVIATELVIKADLVRSGKDTDNHHLLKDLYEALDDTHRQETDDRFARCEPNAMLKMVGEPILSVSDVLAVYDKSRTYLDTRYYAEPTTKFKKSTGLHRANLAKASTPYPIFLPYVVDHLIATFRFFDGAARLQRLGGQVRRGARDATENNHGDWGLVPSSLNLVVVQVAQHSWRDAQGQELPEFGRWRRSRPPSYSTEWMYGGSRLLFYRADQHTPPDSETDIDGLPCRIWSKRYLGIHSRDLYRLADVLESGAMLNTMNMD